MLTNIIHHLYVTFSASASATTTNKFNLDNFSSFSHFSKSDFSRIHERYRFVVSFRSEVKNEFMWRGCWKIPASISSSKHCDIVFTIRFVSMHIQILFISRRNFLGQHHRISCHPSSLIWSALNLSSRFFSHRKKYESLESWTESD